jgi:hypothetical protein
VRRALLALLLGFALGAAVPAVALAQYDAGGGQYVDPIGPGGGGGGGGTSGGGGGGASGTTASVTPGVTSGSGTQGEPAATAEANEIATAPGDLPRTGFPIGWLMLPGGFLLACGLSLRRVAGNQGA